MNPDGPRPGGVVAALVATTLLVAIVALAVLALDAAPRDASPTAVDAPPLELDSVSDQLAAHYRAAADHEDTYAAVPCYCGCEEFLGHRHLADCFVRRDGAGWDAHAAGCGICIAESDLVRTLLASGASDSEVRADIVARFGATPGTAPPAA